MHDLACFLAPREYLEAYWPSWPHLLDCLPGLRGRGRWVTYGVRHWL